jgi:hypothetical protein
MAAGASDTSTSVVYAITQADMLMQGGNLAIVTGNPPIEKIHIKFFY